MGNRRTGAASVGQTVRVTSARGQPEQVRLGDHQPNRPCCEEGANWPEDHRHHDAGDEDREPHPVAGHESRRVRAPGRERCHRRRPNNPSHSGQNQECDGSDYEHRHVASVGVGQARRYEDHDLGRSGTSAELPDLALRRSALTIRQTRAARSGHYVRVDEVTTKRRLPLTAAGSVDA
jgi:hypothetical protein